jgi:ATP-dependent Clp protease protease subunit
MTKPVAEPFPPRRPGDPRHPEPPPRPFRPGEPHWPGEPRWPGEPTPVPRTNPAIQPARVWLDQGGWPARLYERLLDKRIVIAHGHLDGEAATRLSAQLLALDAEGTAPIRLELQGLDADLSAALSVMGVLDVVRGPVSGYAGGKISGPALGVLAAATHRLAYPNALFVLSEPRMSLDGSVTTVAAQEHQVSVMLDDLFTRLAEVTGREPAQIRADAQRETLLTAAEAIAYGLVEEQVEPHRSAGGVP